MNPISVILIACLFGGLLVHGLRDPLAWTCVAAVIWILFAMGHGQGKKFKFWLPFLFWAALCAGVSPQPLQCVYALSRWAALAAFFSLACASWGKKEKSFWFWGLCLVGFVLGLAALKTGWAGLAQGRGWLMTGLLPPYYNYTVFAQAAAAAAIMGALLQESGGDKNRLILWPLFIFFVLNIMLARSRGGLLALACAGAWCAFRNVRSRFPQRSRRIFLVLVCAIVFGAVLGRIVASSQASPLSYALKLEMGQAFQRPQIWRSALAAFGDRPLFGWGPGNFEQGFLLHNFASGYGPFNYQFTTAYAHSEILQILTETGWPGLCLLLWAIFSGFKLPDPMSVSWEEEAALAALAAMAAQLAVDNMLQIPALGMLFFSALAIAGGDTLPNSGDLGTPYRIPRNSVRCPQISIGLVLCLAAWAPQHLVQSYRSQALQSRDLPKRLALLQKAARLLPADAGLREEVAYAWLTQRPAQPEEAIWELRQASRISPTNAVYWAMQAEILRHEAPDSWPRILVLAHQAETLEPNFLQARLLSAESFARLGRQDEAREELRQMLRSRALIAATPVSGSGYDSRLAYFDAGRFNLVSRLVQNPPLTP